MVSTSAKKNIEFTRCVSVTIIGSLSSTVTPPSAPWASTSGSAILVSSRIRPASGVPGRRARSTSQVMMMVSTPTAVASSRCECSYKIPPFMSGKALP